MSCKDSREMWMKQKDEPIRVAQIMGKLWAGGVEMVVFNYYRAIDKSKIQFDFYYDADSTVEPPQDLIDMGARFYKIPPYQKLPQYIRELKKHLKENQYLIVHSHLNTLSVFPLFVAWMCRVPVRVAHNHSVPSGKELKRDALKYFLRIFGRVFPTDYFACSEKAGRWMFGNRNYDAGKVVVIKNATDFERFRADEETIEKLKKQLGLNDKFVIGHIGRFTFAKNHEFLLDVFKKIGSISRGRTVRQTILGGYVFGVGSTLTSFIVLGNYSMGMQVTGKADFIAQYLESGDLYGMIVSIIKTMPGAPVIMVVVLLTMIAFYATSFDSIALTASCYSYHTLKDGEQPNKGIQLMWCILLILLPIALLFAESSMNNLQSVSIVAAFPIGAVIVMIAVSFMKDAKKYMESLEDKE